MTNKKILVVDDNPINLELIKVLLLPDGYDLRTAGDAAEALNVLNDFHPQLILMDIQLPGMDGLELTKQLRADVKRRDIKIVALTAYTMKDDKERILAAGCDGYITKPIDTASLSQVVKEYLEEFSL